MEQTYQGKANPPVSYFKIRWGQVTTWVSHGKFSRKQECSQTNKLSDSTSRLCMVFQVPLTSPLPPGAWFPGVLTGPWFSTSALIPSPQPCASFAFPKVPWLDEINPIVCFCISATYFAPPQFCTLRTFNSSLRKPSIFLTPQKNAISLGWRACSSLVSAFQTHSTGAGKAGLLSLGSRNWVLQLVLIFWIPV